MPYITYGSVCSGIEAATQAWHPLGMRAAWFAGSADDFCNNSKPARTANNVYKLENRRDKQNGLHEFVEHGLNLFFEVRPVYDAHIEVLAGETL